MHMVQSFDVELHQAENGYCDLEAFAFAMETKERYPMISSVYCQSFVSNYHSNFYSASESAWMINFDVMCSTFSTSSPLSCCSPRTRSLLMKSLIID